MLRMSFWPDKAERREIVQIVNKPIFRVTSMKKEIVMVYSLLGVGFAFGLLAGFMLWHH